MSRNYHIDQPELKIARQTARDRLDHISRLLSTFAKPAEKNAGRNFLTRSLDTAFAFVRYYLPPIHWFFAAITAMVLFLYAQFVAATARLDTAGTIRWPVSTPCVLALWHRDAPTLLVAFAKNRPHARTLIMVAGDPRGDYIAMLCRWLGFAVVRGDSDEGGWEALQQLANGLLDGACVILTADGGGPAQVAKFGAVALASSAGVPLIPLFADCHPAIPEPHKWDAARNPVPFCKLTISLGPPRVFGFFEDLAHVEEARAWLEQKLNRHKEEQKSQMSS